MRFNTLFLSLLINLVYVYARKRKYNVGTFEIGSSSYCKPEHLTKHNKVYYASISKELMNESLCDKYVVAMIADSKAYGKYKLVKARIRDECEDCEPTQIRLSTKAFRDLKSSKKSKKSNVIWGILSKDGKMITGPFQPEITEKETQELVNSYDGVNFDEILSKFIMNAKYMTKYKKANFKKLNNIKVEIIKKIIKHNPFKINTNGISPIIEPFIIPSNVPVIEPIDEPSEDSDDELTITIGQSVESTIEPTSEPTNESVEQTVTIELSSVSINEVTNEPTIEPTITIEPISEPVIIPTIEPTITIEPISEPANEPANEPTVEPTITIEPISEPVIIPTIEPTITIEPISEPVIIPTNEPTITIEPVSETVNEPTAEPTVADEQLINPAIDEIVEEEDNEPGPDDATPVPDDDDDDDVAEAVEDSNKKPAVVTGALAVSLAAGAAFAFVRRRSTRKNYRNYIFGVPLDKIDGSTTTTQKVLYANTKSGEKIKLEIPYEDFDDVAHIQIFSPNLDQDLDVYNVHTQRALMSNGHSLDDDVCTHPQPQHLPRPHSLLPVPKNDFMMAFSPIEPPESVALPKVNIGPFNCTNETGRVNDDPYLSQYRGNDNQEIYSSVPQHMNRNYAKNSNEPSTDILLEYVDGDDY